METLRLKQFCVIAETGSLSKAAELLHITHSGLSKSMKLLQEELKTTLLQPAGRGLMLTQEGLVIYQRAKEFLLQEERLFKSFKQTPELTDYRIGTMEIFMMPLIAGLHRASFNHRKVKLLDLDPGIIEKMLIDDQLEAGITYAPYPMPNLDIIEIGQFKMGCYFSNADFKKMPIHEVPFVAPAQGQLNNPLNIRERDGWIDSMQSRTIKYEVNLLSTAIELTLQGLCAIHIPDFVAQEINAQRNATLQEHAFTKSKGTTQTAYFLKRQNQICEKDHEQICSLLKAQFESSALRDPSCI